MQRTAILILLAMTACTDDRKSTKLTGPECDELAALVVAGQGVAELGDPELAQQVGVELADRCRAGEGDRQELACLRAATGDDAYLTCVIEADDRRGKPRPRP